jgi:hypothetical protein
MDPLDDPYVVEMQRPVLKPRMPEALGSQQTRTRIRVFLKLYRFQFDPEVSK